MYRAIRSFLDQSVKFSSFLRRPTRSLATVSRSRRPAESTMESCPGEPNRCSKPQLQGVPPSGGPAVTVSLSLLVFVSWGPPPASRLLLLPPSPSSLGMARGIDHGIVPWGAQSLLETSFSSQLQGVPSLETWAVTKCRTLATFTLPVSPSVELSLLLFFQCLPV